MDPFTSPPMYEIYGNRTPEPPLWIKRFIGIAFLVLLFIVGRYIVGI